MLNPPILYYLKKTNPKGSKLFLIIVKLVEKKKTYYFRHEFFSDCLKNF